jgi:hypothetical protein
LRAFHRYARDEDGGYVNWKYVVEEISDAAGPDFLGFADDRDTPARRTRVKQAAERLRQFVEGKRDKDGTRSFQSMQERTLDAIMQFVRKESLLSDDELTEHAPDSQAALRLLEYLDQGFDQERVLPLAKFDGTYAAKRPDARDFVVYELTLQRPSGDGLMQATLIEDRYREKAAVEFDGLTPEERQKQRRSRTFYGGWAIFTPEETVMVFLKQASTARNLYQFTLAADMSLAAGADVDRLVLLRHDYPVELDYSNREEGDLLRSVMEESGRNVFVFRRTP